MYYIWIRVFPNWIPVRGSVADTKPVMDELAEQMQAILEASGFGARHIQIEVKPE